MFASVGLVAALASAWPRLARADEPFPALAVAVARARARAPAVVAAAGARRVAAALGVGARLPSLGNPYLEVFADRGAAREAPELAVQSNLWIPFDASGQRARRIEANERLRGWRQAQLTEVGSDTAADVVRGYGVAVVDAERVRFMEKIVAISMQEAALYEARLNASDVTRRDAELAAVDLSRNRMSLAEARADLSLALAALAGLVGAPALTVPAADQPAPDGLWTLAARAPEEIVDEAPALRALAREAEYFTALEARDAVEGHAPVNVIVSAGRGPEGRARLGAGLAWTFPVLRRNQGERARAVAERERAQEVAGAVRTQLRAQLTGMVRERAEVRSALDELRAHAAPAAEAAVAAARATERAGKGDLLHVVTTRRDLVSVRASGLAFEQREWLLLAALVSLTGRNP